MLPRRFRLPGSQIRRVLGGKRVFSEGSLVIKVIPNELNFSRLGVLVSAKFLPKAVQRNRLRRQLYSLVDMGQVTSGFDIAVIISKPHVH